MTDSTELAELESGLTSGFWQRLCAHVEREWGLSGETYRQAIQKATQGPTGTEAESVQRLKVVVAQQDAIMRLLKWPDERVATIKGSVQRQIAGAGPSRRGAGL